MTARLEPVAHGADPRRGLAVDLVADHLRFALGLADRVRALLKGASGVAASAQNKSDGSIVTRFDTDAESDLRERIAQRHPDHGFLGEEFGAEHPDADFRWVLDPIDGTADFVRGIPTFGTLLALEYRGLPVVSVVDHPALDLRSYAAYGQGAWRNDIPLRPAGAAASPVVVLPAFANFPRQDRRRFMAIVDRFLDYRVLRNCYGHSLAFDGSVDAVLEYAVDWWDLAASRLIMEEAAGYFSAWQLPDRQDAAYVAVFGKPAVAQELERVVRAPC